MKEGVSIPLRLRLARAVVFTLSAAAIGAIIYFLYLPMFR